MWELLCSCRVGRLTVAIFCRLWHWKYPWPKEQYCRYQLSQLRWNRVTKPSDRQTATLNYHQLTSKRQAISEPDTEVQQCPQLTPLPPVEVLGGLEECCDAHFVVWLCVVFHLSENVENQIFASSASVTAFKLRYLMQGFLLLLFVVVGATTRVVDDAKKCEVVSAPSFLF